MSQITIWTVCGAIGKGAANTANRCILDLCQIVGWTPTPALPQTEFPRLNPQTEPHPSRQNLLVLARTNPLLLQNL